VESQKFVAELFHSLEIVKNLLQNEKEFKKIEEPVEKEEIFEKEKKS